MSNIIIFSGTTEGRSISEALCRAEIPHRVCVASSMGEEVMTPSPFCRLMTGRMDEGQMLELMEEEETLVVDATHPYATAVSENIRKACKARGRACLRIRRSSLEDKAGEREGLSLYDSAQSCANALKNTEGNILLTTGSKDLAIYCEDESVRSRIYARVLPGVESMELCQKAGLDARHIIGMFGPFSQAMNELMLREYQIRHLVSKESGRAGGFGEKLAAAEACGCQLHLIRRPAEAEGISVEEAIEQLLSLCGKKPQGRKESQVSEPGLEISLVGIGMGQESDLTLAAHQVIREADVILGAARMIRAYSDRITRPLYLARDVIPYLEELLREGKLHRVALLFSGDTGSYSGASAMWKALLEWKKQKEYVSLRMYPGISSVAALASRIGEAYSDSAVLSMHGKTKDSAYMSCLYASIRKAERAYLLLSGWQDLNLLGEAMGEQAAGINVTLGYQLGYPEEEILSFRLDQLPQKLPEGLYIAFLQNKNVSRKPFMTLLPDQTFDREKVPMTKAQIRHLSVAHLGLYEKAVVYDIGSGTGSVSCEIAIQSPTLQVYAIEKKPQAAELTRKNAEKLGLSNVKVIEGLAPEILEPLPLPSHVFIGGSSGNLQEILACLQEKAGMAGKDIRVVINAISLETISEITEIGRHFACEDEEIVQISCASSRKVGGYHLMESANPVYIASFLLKGQNG